MAASYVDNNPTMATASMTMASHSPRNPSIASSTVNHYVESREESIEKLKANLTRYARSNDRRMVLRSLKDASFLSYIPLDAPIIRSDVSLSDLENEVSMSKVILNENVLTPPSEVGKNAEMCNGSAMIIKGVLYALGKDSSMYKPVFFRLAESSASADVFSQLNAMMGSTELIVKKLSPDYTVKSNAAIVNKKKTSEAGEPCDLTLYNAGGQVHMTLESQFNFGLFRKSDGEAPRAWIVMKCKVHERTNLSTNETVRSMNMETPDLY